MMRRFAINPTPALEEQDLNTDSESEQIQLTEINEDEQTLDMGLEEIVQAGTDLDSLHSLADVLQTSLDQGGLDVTSAQLLDVAVESIYVRLGVTQKARQPALEAFGEENRKHSTQLALESIVDTAKKIWDAILKALTKAFEWIRDFFVKLFVSAEKLEKKAKELLSKVKLATGEPSEKEFKDKSLASVLYVGKEEEASTDFIDVSDVTSHTKTYLDVLKQVYGNAKGFNNVAGKEIADIIDTWVIGGELKLFDYPLPVYRGFESISDAQAKTIGLIERFPMLNFGGSQIRVSRSKELFGGKAVYLTIPAGKGLLGGDVKLSATSFIRNAKIVGGHFNDYDPSVKIEHNGQMTVLNNAGMVIVLEDAIAIAGEVKDFRDIESELNKTRKRIMAGVGKLRNAKVTLNFADEIKTGIYSSRDLQQVVRGSASILDRPAPQMTAHALRVTKALITYAEKSFSKYKEGAAIKLSDSKDLVVA